MGRAVITAEAQFLHDTFNGKSIAGDALDAARRMIDGNVESKADKSDRQDIQAYLEYLDRLQEVITKARKKGKNDRADHIIEAFVDSICEPEAGFITTTLSDRAKQLELRRINEYEAIDAKQQDREPRLFEIEDIDDGRWQEFLATTQANQRSRISSWVHYLAESESVYPTAFKFYAVRSLLTLKNRVGYDQPEGPANEQGDLLPSVGHHYKKRDGFTLDSFPELNREALAKTFADFSLALASHGKYGELLSHGDKSKKIAETIIIPAEDEASELLNTTELNFAKLYAENMETAGGVLGEERANMQGRWVVYGEGQGNVLAKSLDEFGTGWCIADVGTASAYLKSGEIEIFYSKIPGDPNSREVPRLCIRRKGDSIVEVRGIESAQGVEKVALDTLTARLSLYPEAKDYIKRAEYQELGQSIIEKSAGGEELTPQELRALWGVGYGPTQRGGFGYDEANVDIDGANDLVRALDQIRSLRSIERDLSSMFNDKGKLEAEYIALERSLIEIQDDYIDVHYLEPILASCSLNHAWIAERMIACHLGKNVAENIQLFHEGDHTAIARSLIENQCAGLLADYIDKFTGVDQVAIAKEIILSGQGPAVAYYIGSFTKISDHTEIANLLIANGCGYELTNGLRNFNGLDHSDIANRLIESGDGYSIIRKLNYFTGIEQHELAKRLILNGYDEDVAFAYRKFTDLDINEIAEMLIEANKYRTLIGELLVYGGLNTKIATALIDAGRVGEVAVGLSSFKQLNLDLARTLISQGYGSNVAYSINSFIVNDHHAIALLLIEDGYGKEIIPNLNKFFGIHSKVIAEMLIDDGLGHLVQGSYDNFPELTEQEIMELQNRIEEKGDKYEEFTA